MEQLDLEVADKYNIGLDMSLLKGLTFSIDGFYDKRSNILIDGSGIDIFCNRSYHSPDECGKSGNKRNRTLYYVEKRV